MKLKHKRRKTLVPVCPKCDRTLGGNGSRITPYQCYECSIVWQNSVGDPLNYEAIDK